MYIKDDAYMNVLHHITISHDHRIAMGIYVLSLVCNKLIIRLIEYILFILENRLGIKMDGFKHPIIQKKNKKIDSQDLTQGGLVH